MHTAPYVNVVFNQTGEVIIYTGDVLSKVFWNMIIIFLEVFLLIWVLFAIAVCVSWAKEKYNSKARWRKVKELPLRVFHLGHAARDSAFDSDSCVICIDDFRGGEYIH